MPERLDELLARIAASPPDRALAALERAITDRIVARRREAHAALLLAPVGLASIGLALAMGVTVGQAVASGSSHSPGAYGSVAASAHLAPSTLLDGRQ